MLVNWLRQHPVGRATSSLLCVAKAWGGVGCWEGGRTHRTCCDSLPPSPDFSRQTTPTTCEERLLVVSKALDETAVRRLVEPVQARVEEQTLRHMNSSRWVLGDVLAPFAPVSALELEMMLELTALVSGVLDSAGIGFWARGTTLLGVLRHYGPVPWSRSIELAASGTAGVVEAALTGLTHQVAGAFGPVRVSAKTAPECAEACDLWVVAFLRSVTLGGDATRYPTVTVYVYDADRVSCAWTRREDHCGTANMSGTLLPAVQWRPFGRLRLPVPRDPWGFLEARTADSHSAVGRHPLELCLPEARTSDTTQHRRTVVQATVPCAALSTVFPMVLFRRVFESTAELLRELGKPLARNAKTLHQSMAAAVPSSTGLPLLRFSVEVAVDAMRGAHAVLVADEIVSNQGKGTCLLGVHGVDLLAGKR